MHKNKWLVRGGWSVYLLWHLIFVIVALSIILPYLTLPIINDARIGAAPWHYAIYVSLLVLIPFASLVIVWLRFRDNVVSALKLFYAVELPIMLLILLRVTLFRDAPVSSQLLFINIIIGISAYFIMLWNRQRPMSHKVNNVAFGFSTITALVGLYLGLLLGLFFAPILLSLVAEIWWDITSFDLTKTADFILFIIKNPLAVLTFMLVFITGVFFLITPVVLIVAYLYQFKVAYKKLPLAAVITILSCVLLTETVLFSLNHEQPQLKAFALTETLPTEDALRHQLLSQKEIIRDGLVNAYLSPYRYLSSISNSHSVNYNYEKIFGENSSIASFAQSLFNVLAAPFLYQGDSLDSDKILALDRYQQFFDTPIEKAERKSIIDAIKATWENEDNEAGLINAASHQVLLTEQNIVVEEQGNFASITITQTLLNQTFQSQEVVFHFSLPEDAVITGLWMSDDLTQPEKFKHVVAPRGAAQSVYKSEVKRRIDPALLEKVGPVQYRLRAFPVPPRVKVRHKGNRYNKLFTNFTVEPALVQFQYVVSIDDQGHWPMPTLLEKRNVYWDEQTNRSHVSQHDDHDELSGWLPDSLAALMPEQLHTHRVLVNGQAILAVPREKKSTHVTIDTPIAIIVDGSYSMNSALVPLNEQLEWLDEKAIKHDLFFCQVRCEQTDSKSIRQKVYFGNSQLNQQLSAWSKLNKTAYASVFVLTDQGSYELSTTDDLKLDITTQPLWLIHLDGLYPYAYDDAVIDAINDSHGGIANSLAEAVDNFQLSQEIGQSFDEGQLIGISQQYFWYRVKTTDFDTDKNIFTVLAADKWINYLATRSDKNQLQQLDKIHAIAKQYDIASFYSSLLVLVEDRQRELLKQAEARDDRFEREVETGAENLGKPMDPFAVPGVPEPEEWALLIIVGCFLLVSYTRRKRQLGL